MLLLRRLTLLVATISALCVASTHVWAMPATQDTSIRLSCRVEPIPLALNQAATLIIEVVNMQNLYGYDLNMTYDVSRVQMQDANPNASGVNLDLVGKFLSPDFVLKNSADSGAITVILTQLSPSQAKSGNGELARITFTGLAAGFVNFAFSKATFSDTEGTAIAVTTEDCLVEIGTAGAPTPTFTALPTFTATPLPSQTPTPSPTPTSTPVITSAATLAAQSNTAPSTATFTPMPPTATFTPVPPTATFTMVPPTATFTPMTQLPQPGVTETPTQFVPPTATVLVITTPTPAPAAVDPRGQEIQPQTAPADLAIAPTATLPATLPTATPPAEEFAATVPTSAAFETAPTATPPLPTAPPSPTASPIPALGQEALSPPQIAPASMQAVQAETPSVDVTALFTPTPLLIAKVDALPPRARIIVDQPSPIDPPFRGEVLRTAAGITMLCAMLLGIFAWRLRRK